MFQNLLKKIHTILKELILFKEIEMRDNELNPDALEIINDVRIKISFRPKASLSAIGHIRNKGERIAKIIR